MTHEHTRACVALLAGWAILGLAAPGHGQSDIKKITVVDANGVPVNRAGVYRVISFAWDERTGTARQIPREPLCRTDADGEFAVGIARLGSGSVYLIANDSLDLMACLYISHRDSGEPATIRLERAARLKAVFESRQVTLSRPDLSISFALPERRTVFADLITVTYAFAGPVNRVPVDVPCPSGCSLNLSMSVQGGVLPVSREVPLLKPGQVLDLGSIEPLLKPASDSTFLGQAAPELQVAEWVKGEPVTLAELKGNVVLLDFWALWCGPCCEALPGLALFHEKYAADGLVIIAIHDASQTRASLLDRSRGRVDLSKLPFRIALDLPVGGSTTPGTGRTIEAYGVTGFPTTVLINRQGRVEGAVYANLEDSIHSLLYGRPMPKPATPTGRLLAEDRRDFTKIGVAAGLILVLLIVLISLFLHSARHRTGEP